MIGVIFMNTTKTKKTTQTKTATFSLEPDGFSIHTFELSQMLKKKEFYRTKSELYEMKETSDCEGTMYREREGFHVCSYFQSNGIRLALEHSKTENAHLYFVRMIVNPRKLIDPCSSYLGIFPPEKSSIHQLKEEFAELFRFTPIDNDINHYKLRRLDFCTNISCDTTEFFREMVRVLRKLPTPPKYTRIYHEEKDKKKQNKYNKHYIKFACGTHSLVMYDKTYQIEDQNLSVEYEDLPQGILRFELQCGRDYLRQYEKVHFPKNTTDFLWKLTKNSQNMITRHFAQCFDDVKFIHFEQGLEKISKSKYSDEIKAQQKTLMQELQRKQSVDAALDQLELSGDDRKKLLLSFDRMGFSPIPLRENFRGKFLYGPVSLLEEIGNGDLLVKYEKDKWV